MGKDYRKTAEEVLQYIGGKDNIEQAAHCVTRLRIALKDESKIDNDKLQSVSLVKGAFHNAGVFQIVIGPGCGSSICRIDNACRYEGSDSS